MSIFDVNKADARDTAYYNFGQRRSQRQGLNSGSTYDQDTGRSCLTRWIVRAFSYADFASNPDATGHRVQIKIPRGTIVDRVQFRVDTAFVGTGNSDIDAGDSNDSDGWADGLDFSSTGVKFDHNAAYNTGTAASGSAGMQFYENGGMLNVLFKNATAPTAGEALVYMRMVSYHEDLSAEW